MWRGLTNLRCTLACCFCFASALTLAFYFLPWRFVIPGYRFPYHGIPSLIVGVVALGLGIFGTNRNWGAPQVKWPWLAVLALVAVQSGLLIAFLFGPNVAVGRGTNVAPWGETPIELSFDIKPLRGAYAAVSVSLISLFLALLALLSIRIEPKPGNTAESPGQSERQS